MTGKGWLHGEFGYVIDFQSPPSFTLHHQEELDAIARHPWAKSHKAGLGRPGETAVPV